MSKLIRIIAPCVLALAAYAQSSSEWQRGTVTAVATHLNPPGQDADAAQYDVSIQVGNTVYVVLYTPPNGANTVQYSPGVDLLVLVGSSTLKFNSKLTGTTEVPILRKQVISAESSPDLSKVPGQYFSLKLKNLSEKLSLSEEQQAKARPILERETAEVGQMWGNPVLSREDKLGRWEKIVRSSDKRLKPFLANDQVQKLEALRRAQKEELKRIATQPKQE